MKLRPEIAPLLITIAVILTVVLGVIFISSETKEINKKISSVFFVSLTKNKPVFLHIPALEYYTQDQKIIWEEAEQDHPDRSVGVFNGINPRNFDILTELQAIAIINDLSNRYPYSRDPEPTHTPDRIDRTEESVSGNNEDKTTYSAPQLLDIFRNNKFQKSLKNSLGLTLPPNTKIKYLPGNKENRALQIKFSELLTFETTITIKFSSYRAGLGNAANYIKFTQPSNEWDIDLSKQDSYGIVVIDIICSSTFFSPFRGNPNVNYYRKWFTGMFNNLHKNFDWQRCDQYMENYNKELGHLKFGETPSNDWIF